MIPGQSRPADTALVACGSSRRNFGGDVAPFSIELRRAVVTAVRLGWVSSWRMARLLPVPATGIRGAKPTG